MQGKGLRGLQEVPTGYGGHKADREMSHASSIHVTAERRIMRAGSDWGVLMLIPSVGDIHCDAIRKRCEQLTHQLDVSDRGASEAHKRALRRLKASCESLCAVATSKDCDTLVARAREHVFGSMRPVKHQLLCPVDVEALRDFAETFEALERPSHSDGQSYHLTYRQMCLKLVNAAGCGEKGGRLLLRYRHSPLGAALVDAGLVADSRLYAVGVDPFKYPKRIRRLCLQKYGVDFDDVAAYPRAKVAIAKCGRSESLAYLSNRECIMEQIGNHFLPSLPAPIRRQHVKVLFNSLDMDGTYEGWRKTSGIPKEVQLNGLSVRLSCGGLFDLENYMQQQPAATNEIAKALPQMLSYIGEWQRSSSPHSDRVPSRTLKSYVLQEMEAFSREAKMKHCVCNGHAVINLQHDGVVVRPSTGTDPSVLRMQLSRVCTSALGYTQPVECKEM